MGSAALAAAAFGGLSAHAQTREGTHQAEGDHSSSNPGQENKPLLTQNPNSNTPPPTDNGDVAPIWYSYDLTKKRIQEGGWTHQGDTARVAILHRPSRRQHALDIRQLSRTALAYRG